MIVTTISILIKVISFIIVMYAFYHLTTPRGKEGIYTRYYEMEKKYTTLRTSLLFVAALILVEVGSMITAINTNTLSERQLLLPDIIFIGLILLLSRIYQFSHKWEAKPARKPRASI